MKLSLFESKSELETSIGKVICGFPGIGKSTVVKKLQEEGYSILDSDSSTFDKKDFPANYINHIKTKISEGYSILASSHEKVRDALKKEGVEFILVYPNRELKEEYLKRYKERGSPNSFIDLLEKNWEEWIEQCENETAEKHELQKGEFLDSALVKGFVTH